MIPQHGRKISILALATAGCLWGTGFYFGKIALSEMPVAAMVLFRFAFACAGLLPVIFFDHPRFNGKECGWVLAASVLGVPVQYLVQFKGLSLTTVSHASLMVGTLPMLPALAAVLFSGEQLHFGGWLALAASTIGAGLIALSSKNASGAAQASMRGDVLVVLSMFRRHRLDSDFKAPDATAFSNDGNCIRVLDGHGDSGCHSRDQIGRPLPTLLDPRMGRRG